MRRRTWVIAGLLAAGAALLAAWPYAAAARMLVTMTGRPAWATFAAADTASVLGRDVPIPTRHGIVASRVYELGDARPGRVLIVFPGVHGGGVDEPRLVALATRLAASGARVVTVPLPDLRVYRLTARSTDVIEDAVRWITADATMAPTGRAGLIGVSFAGGLTIVAAGRPAIRDQVQAVVALGGHGDLPRVMRFLVTGRLADGTAREPHDYGLAVLALEAAPRLVPPDERVPFESALRAFLDASSLESTDVPAALARLDVARERARTLPGASAAVMREVLERDVVSLGARLESAIGDIGVAPALSPERSPAPTAPIFLLHGLDDRIIPESESVALASHLTRAGAEVTTVLTPLFSHTDLSPRAGAADVFRIVRAWRQWMAVVREAP